MSSYYARGKVVLADGQVFLTEEWPDAVSQQINDARGTGKLIAITLATIPTGGQAWIDPDRVQSVSRP